MKRVGILLLLTCGGLAQAGSQWENTSSGERFSAEVLGSNGLFFIEMEPGECTGAVFGVVASESSVLPDVPKGKRKRISYMLFVFQEKGDGESEVDAGSLHGIITNDPQEGLYVSLLRADTSSPYAGYNDYIRAMADADYIILQTSNRNGEGITYRFTMDDFADAYDGMIDACTDGLGAGQRLKKTGELR